MPANLGGTSCMVNFWLDLMIFAGSCATRQHGSSHALPTSATSGLTPPFGLVHRTLCMCAATRHLGMLSTVAAGCLMRRLLLCAPLVCRLDPNCRHDAGVHDRCSRSRCLRDSARHHRHRCAAHSVPDARGTVTLCPMVLASRPCRTSTSAAPWTAPVAMMTQRLVPCGHSVADAQHPGADAPADHWQHARGVPPPR